MSWVIPTVLGHFMTCKPVTWKKQTQTEKWIRVGILYRRKDHC